MGHVTWEGLYSYLQDNNVRELLDFKPKMGRDVCFSMKLKDIFAVNWPKTEIRAVNKFCRSASKQTFIFARFANNNFYLLKNIIQLNIPI